MTNKENDMEAAVKSAIHDLVGEALSETHRGLIQLRGVVVTLRDREVATEHFENARVLLSKATAMARK